MSFGNIFESLSGEFREEVFEEILRSGGVRIERILSKGHTSPQAGWYDQDENEWVIVLQGSGKLAFENGDEVVLEPGDYINIPRNRKHKVSWTDPAEVTLWLAVFYD